MNWLFALALAGFPYPVPPPSSTVPGDPDPGECTIRAWDVGPLEDGLTLVLKCALSEGTDRMFEVRIPVAELVWIAELVADNDLDDGGGDDFTVH